MTEEEAREKDCYQWAMLNSPIAAWPKYGQLPCSASKCMAWVWDKTQPVSMGVEKTSNTSGHCGLVK